MPSENLDDFPITSQKLSAISKISIGTIYSHVNAHGSFYGLVPKKLPNARLRWPRDTRDRLIQIGLSMMAQRPSTLHRLPVPVRLAIVDALQPPPTTRGKPTISRRAR